MLRLERDITREDLRKFATTLRISADYLLGVTDATVVINETRTLALAEGLKTHVMVAAHVEDLKAMSDVRIDKELRADAGARSVIASIKANGNPLLRKTATIDPGYLLDNVTAAVLADARTEVQWIYDSFEHLGRMSETAYAISHRTDADATDRPNLYTEIMDLMQRGDVPAPLPRGSGLAWGPRIPLLSGNTLREG